MSSRGAYGFYKDNTNKITYNHYDSYPSVLGKSIINFIVNTTNQEMEKIFHDIELVNENEGPSDDQLEDIKNYTPVDDCKTWYSALNFSQGDLIPYKQGLKYMCGGYEKFIEDSLMCEYAYIINLDDGVLEFYKGKNKRQRNEYRYKSSNPVIINDDITYYACSLVRKYPLDVIRQFPDNTLSDMKKRIKDE